MKVVREQLLIILVGMISLGFTIFILINSYEVFSNQDIPYISSLRLMEAQEVIDRVIQITDENSLLKEFETDTPSMGELDYMYFPSTDDRIFIGKNVIITVGCKDQIIFTTIFLIMMKRG
ncbi:hypothetical protein HC766_06635 [Candidatus Gracilibacteria bacterium]|nr:hypothetical protein [Candidatus Gracilibacteria bacterium]